MTLTHKIYALKNPLTQEYFYVGITGASLNVRLNGHMSSTDKNDDKLCVINKIKAAGHKPEIVLLEEIPVIGNKDNREKEVYWVNALIKAGHPLTNKKNALSGRKPADSAKIQISLYITQPDIDKFGGVENIKKYLYDYIDAYNETPAN